MGIPSIKLKKEFDLVYQKGKAYGGSFFSLRVLKSRDDFPSRFGIVISTKITKKAVDRNRKRRQIKEILRLNSKRIANGYLALFTLKDGGLSAEYGELEKEIVQLLGKAGMVK